jgi:hypothetical protein
VAGGSIDGAVDTDLGVLLRPLSHLQDLFLGMDMSWSPPERQLRSLADARPSLRSLRLTGTYYLAPLLDDPPHTPAFPVLERLRATHFDMLHSSGTRYVPSSFCLQGLSDRTGCYTVAKPNEGSTLCSPSPPPSPPYLPALPPLAISRRS